MFQRYLKLGISHGQKKSDQFRKLIDLIFNKSKNQSIELSEVHEDYSDNGLDYFGDGGFAAD